MRTPPSSAPKFAAASASTSASPRSQPSAPPPANTDAPFLRYELVEGRSSKFWEIRQDDTSVTVRYGRIGARGQTQVKTFDTAPRATREVEKLTAEKLRKGYQPASA